MPPQSVLAPCVHCGILTTHFTEEESAPSCSACSRVRVLTQGADKEILAAIFFEIRRLRLAETKQTTE